jgi:hypothetical protein
MGVARGGGPTYRTAQEGEAERPLRRRRYSGIRSMKDEDLFDGPSVRKKKHPSHLDFTANGVCRL